VVQRAGVAGADGEGSRVAPVRLGEVVKVVLVEQAEVCEGVAGRLFVAAHGEDGLVHSLSDEVLSAVVLEPADVVGSFPRRWLRLKGSVVMLAGLFKISFSMIEGAEIRKCPHMWAVSTQNFVVTFYRLFCVVVNRGMAVRSVTKKSELNGLGILSKRFLGGVWTTEQCRWDSHSRILALLLIIANIVTWKLIGSIERIDPLASRAENQHPALIPWNVLCCSNQNSCRSSHQRLSFRIPGHHAKNFLI
jgi:hypothetical protein